MKKHVEIDKVSSVEVISSMIQQATLSKKEKERIKRELDQQVEGGMGTVRLKSGDELDKYIKECDGNLVSPGGAASSVGVSRARIHQLEAEGKIRVFRYDAKEPPITEEDIKDILKSLPFWVRPFVSYKPPKKSKEYIFVDMGSLEKYMKSIGKEEEK